MTPSPPLRLAASIALCVALAAALGARDLALPGLYYDEVIQAEPAIAFLAADPRPSEIPGMRDVRLLGRRWPWMTQPYMGALKSQALIPVFALLTPDATHLRAATLAWALVALALTMLWADRVLGLGVATATGLLLAVDPSFLYVARHDWGSFSLGLLLRCAALLLLQRGHAGRSPAWLFAGGLCAGLGVYNKIDFAVWGVAAALALACAQPGLVRAALGARRRETAAALAGLVLGAAPLLLAAGGALGAAGAASRARAETLGEKLAVAAATLDGSYFERLMLAGGRFERLPEVAGDAAGPGLALLVVACVFLLALLARERWRGRWDPPRPAQAFCVLCLVLTLTGLLLTPRAVRVHHYLNAWPFPQLVLAIAGVELWRRAGELGALRTAARIALATLALSLLGGSLRLDEATHDTLERTGGRGRWSDAPLVFARALPPTDRLVCLDWGFAGPLRFALPRRQVAEPVWQLRRAGGAPVAIAGTPDDVYLVNPPDLAVFPYGEALLRALEGLPADSASVSVHRDREGHEVFRSIRFRAPHRLRFQGNRARVELR